MYFVHDSAMDVFIEVLKVYKGSTYHRVKVRWWNNGYDGTNAWCIDPRPQTIKIPFKDWNSWKPFDPGVDIHPGRR